MGFGYYTTLGWNSASREADSGSKQEAAEAGRKPAWVVPPLAVILPDQADAATKKQAEVRGHESGLGAPGAIRVESVQPTLVASRSSNIQAAVHAWHILPDTRMKRPQRSRQQRRVAASTSWGRL